MELDKRWDCKRGDFVRSEKVERFLEDLEILCRRHGVVISHEDGEGAFVLEHFDTTLFDWMRDIQLGGTLPDDFRPTPE